MSRSSFEDSGTRRISGRELLLIFLFWTSLATLSSVNRMLDPRFGFRVVSPAGPIALVFLESWIWAALTPVIFLLSSRFSIDRGRWLVRIPLLVLLGVVVAIAVYTLLDFIRTEVVSVQLPRRRSAPTFTPFRDMGRLRFVQQLLTYLALLATGFAREYFLRDRHREHEAVALQAETARLQAQLADARLDALRMQLNPHFLFNTLHAISALVERDPSGVRRMIARLSELLRHTIDSGADEVTLREELTFLRRYIEIMEIRFQGKLRVELDVADAALEALVPNLVLQPLVENALEHGASRASGEGRIALSAQIVGDDLVLRVRDNGPGLTSTPRIEVRSGVGVANTRARLQQLYGEDASLTLRTAEEGGTLAQVTLPFHTAEDLRASGEGDV